MPEFEVPKHIRREPGEGAKDGKRLDEICRLARDAIERPLEDLLRKKTASEGADSIGEEVRAAIELACDGEEIPDAGAFRELVAGLEGGLQVKLEPELLADRAHEIASVLMSTWIDTLAATADRNPAVWLSGDLLPEDLSEPLRDDWEDALASLALTSGDAEFLLSAVRRALIERTTMDLPLGLSVGPIGHDALIAGSHDPVHTLLEQPERRKRIEDIFDLLKGLLPDPLDLWPVFVPSHASPAGALSVRHFEHSLCEFAGTRSLEVFSAPVKASEQPGDNALVQVFVLEATSRSHEEIREECVRILGADDVSIGVQTVDRLPRDTLVQCLDDLLSDPIG